MGQGSRSAMLVFLGTVAVLFLSCKGVTASQDYTVGGPFGWAIPPNVTNSIGDFYAQWSHNQTFSIGDVLVFEYNTSAHNVQEVQDFYGCNSYYAPESNHTGGSTNITLNSTGGHWFICSYPNHCELGMAVQINVTASNSPTRLAGVFGIGAAVVIAAASFFL